uniref:CCHC-type domain-containing protein n=1 Tax=Tanacetum cinerariifolium TaxID=118510 RepID=A0A6L2LZL0_TANCI|nr:hypothetical protein [Tanacetum cinerariifolium]
MASRATCGFSHLETLLIEGLKLEIHTKDNFHVSSSIFVVDFWTDEEYWMLLACFGSVLYDLALKIILVEKGTFTEVTRTYGHFLRQCSKLLDCDSLCFIVASGSSYNTASHCFQQSRGPSKGYSYPVCTTCGRRHPGECRRAAGTCFKCGQTGHLQKDCKKNTAASTSGQADKKPGASGRVFAITKDHTTKTSEHQAMIDCRSYRVIFGDIHAPEFVYHGSLPGKSMQIISALQARTLLSHGCEGFLATIHDMTLEISSIHDQPIVSEFPDVFPDELPGIPPVREVERGVTTKASPGRSPNEAAMECQVFNDLMFGGTIG